MFSWIYMYYTPFHWHTSYSLIVNVFINSVRWIYSHKISCMLDAPITLISSIFLTQSKSLLNLFYLSLSLLVTLVHRRDTIGSKLVSTLFIIYRKVSVTEWNISALYFNNLPYYFSSLECFEQRVMLHPLLFLLKNLLSLTLFGIQFTLLFSCHILLWCSFPIIWISFLDVWSNTKNASSVSSKFHPDNTSKIEKRYWVIKYVVSNLMKT